MKTIGLHAALIALTITTWSPSQGLTWIPGPSSTSATEYALTAPMDLPSASLFAQSVGGVLASVHTANETAFHVATFGPTADNAWIGLTDELQEGNWVWHDGSPFDYQNWRLSSGEPNGGTSENHVLMDLTGTGHDGQWNDYHQGGVFPAIIQRPHSPAPASQQAVSLDGIDDWIDVPHSPALAVSGDMTVEAWIRIDAYPTQPGEIVNKKGRNPWEGFTLHLQNGFVQFSARSASGTGHTAETNWIHVVPGTWAHVAGVISGSEIRLVINGVLRATNVIPVGGVAGSSATPLRFGYDSEAPTHNPASEFAGLIDEVRYWSVARTASQIQATMYQEIDGLPGLLGCWHLNGDTLDTTGGFHGSLQGDAILVPSTAPLSCGVGGVCLQGNLPFPLGSLATLYVLSPSPTAPIFVLVDASTGSVPLGSYGTSQIAFSPAIFALADPTGIWGPGFTSPWTDAFGFWTFSLPMPMDPAFLGVTLFAEAYVMDLLAPNTLFRQSNLLTITFQ